MCEDGDGVRMVIVFRVGRMVMGLNGSICSSLCLLHREHLNEWQYHGVQLYKCVCGWWWGCLCAPVVNRL